VLHVVGGASRNDLLCELVAEACGREVLAGPAEATALGNVLVQARALGDLPTGASLRDVARASAELRAYHPRHGVASQ
jgi:rhamnulokinase